MLQCMRESEWICADHVVAQLCIRWPFMDFSLVNAFAGQWIVPSAFRSSNGFSRYYFGSVITCRSNIDRDYNRTLTTALLQKWPKNRSAR